jgi:UDP-N-acetylmuramate dehydrogenase
VFPEIAHEAPFDFTKRATIGCGGLADVGFYPRDYSELLRLVDYCRKHAVPYAVVGNLSNVLPPDGRYNGVVISTLFLKNISDGDSVYVEAGVKSGALLDFCEKHGRTGAEFLAGIPCTVGGAVFMNACALGKSVSEIVENVIFYREGRICIAAAEDCEFSYKKSTFMKDGSVVLGASLALGYATVEEVQANRAAALEKRGGQPKGKSMGCIFKNPNGDFAGRLIDGAGLKGLRIGDAVISPAHANFFVNEGNAKSADIRALINLAKNAVFAQYGVELEEEIRGL